MFGAEGQANIRDTKVGIVGLGGLGSHVAQQLVFLGVIDYVLVDDDVVTLSSMNRLIGAFDSDVEERTAKVAVAERLIKSVTPDAVVLQLPTRVEALDVPDALARADVVFGCLDGDLPRLKLTQVCATLQRPYFDLATDTGTDDEGVTYGGRVVFCDGTRCLSCLNLLDQHEMARESMSLEQRAADDRIYGVHRAALGAYGPSVVSVNGAVASLAVTEFMVHVTSLGEPAGHINYYGQKRLIRRSVDVPGPNCPYCWRKPKG